MVRCATVVLVFLFICSVLCIHVRKNQANMSEGEITRFVNAVLQMKENGVYDQFVRLHSLTFAFTRSGPSVVANLCFGEAVIANHPECIDWAHNGPQFSPWHRHFLNLFEQELQKIDASVSLPYWDWTVANSTDPTINPLWNDSFMGGNGDPENHFIVPTGPFAKWPLVWFTKRNELTRRFAVTRLPTARQVNGLLVTAPYDAPPYSGNMTNARPTFLKALEGSHPLPEWVSTNGYMHNNVHNWVRGEMVTGTSPNDPVFFLHHCFIDYLWSKWMLENPLQPPYLPVANGPKGKNLNDFLSPWDGIHNQEGYEYYEQYETIAPSDMNIPISSVAVPDTELGYLYEGLASYYELE